MKNLKITTLKTTEEIFRDKFGKALITWNELEAGPEPDERLLSDIYSLFERHKEDIKYLDSNIFKKVAEFFKNNK